jgi:AraC-like DNA-binding protein
MRQHSGGGAPRFDDPDAASRLRQHVYLAPEPRGDSAPEAFLLDHRVSEVMERLEAGVTVGQRPSFDSLARGVNLSPSRLRHLFRQSVGRSPTRLLRDLQMRRAKRLLETTHLRVKEVMCAVGVNDLSHFVRDFKVAYGQTPGRYRVRTLEDRRRRARAVDVSSDGS